MRNLNPLLQTAFAHSKIEPSRFGDFRSFVYDVEWRMDWKLRYGNTPHPEGLNFAATVPTFLGVTWSDLPPYSPTEKDYADLKDHVSPYSDDDNPDSPRLNWAL